MDKVEVSTIQVNIKRTITVGTTGLLDFTGKTVKLPAPLFLISDYDSEYKNTIVPLLPDNTITYLGMTIPTDDDTGVLLTFGDGRGNQETITITLDGRDWRGTVNWTRNTAFEMKNGKARIDNSLSAAQFNQLYYVIRKSGLTLAKNDFFRPNYFEPDQLPNNIVRDINQKIPIDSERGICPMIIPYSNGVPANGVSWTTALVMNIEYIVKHSSAKNHIGGFGN